MTQEPLTQLCAWHLIPEFVSHVPNSRRSKGTFQATASSPLRVHFPARGHDALAKALDNILRRRIHSTFGHTKWPCFLRVPVSRLVKTGYPFLGWSKQVIAGKLGGKSSHRIPVKIGEQIFPLRSLGNWWEHHPREIFPLCSPPNKW